MSRVRRSALALAVALVGCGSNGSNEPLATAVEASLPELTTEPTTTLLVVPSTSEPEPVELHPDEAALLGTWRFESLDPPEALDATNLDAGYLRIEAPPGLGLSASAIRMSSPGADFVCGPDGPFGGGALLAIDGRMVVTEQYERPAVLCPDNIPTVPLLDPLAACLTNGCSYLLDGDMLRLDLIDATLRLSRI